MVVTINNSLLSKLQRSFQDCFLILPKKILIAVSGGIDSLALTLLIKELAGQHKITIYAVTIDHKLRDNSSLEAQKLHDVMIKLGIRHEIIDWQKDQEIISNIENKARQARYSLLTQYADKHKIPVIVTAHHLDDQIETFFMRLLRGSGIDGLAAINPVTQLNKNLILFRPLLQVTKAQLKEYLLANKQVWFEDDTNNNTKFLRNKVRKFLYEIEDKNLLDQRIIKTTEHFARAKDFLESHTKYIFQKLTSIEEGDVISLDYQEFINLHEEIALRLLIRIFNIINGREGSKGNFEYYNKHNIYKPRFNNLYQLYQKILTLKNNKKLNSKAISMRRNFAKTIITITSNKILFKAEISAG